MTKKIIIFIVVILVIAAGVFGWWFYFKNSDTGISNNFSLSDLNPFGKSPDVVPTNTDTTPNGTATSTPTNTNNTPVVVPTLRKVYDAPVSGFVVVRASASTSPFARFIDKATGHMFEAALDTVSNKRISNTTIPKITETKWFGSGEGLVMRYVKDDGSIESFYAKLGKNATTSDSGEELRELGGTFLPTNISSLAVLAHKEKIAFVNPNADGSVSLFTALPDGSKKSLALTSKIRNWNIEWQKEDTLVLTTKPSHSVLGYSYMVKTKNGTLDKIIGNIPGLYVKTNKDISYALYSGIQGNTVTLGVLDVKKNIVTALPPRTLADKCVWSEYEAAVVFCGVPTNNLGSNLPDSWYQGSVSFNDMIWKINVATGETKLVNDLSKSGTNIDATNLTLDSRDSFLLFTNKKDGTLWSLQLTK